MTLKTTACFFDKPLKVVTIYRQINSPKDMAEKVMLFIYSALDLEEIHNFCVFIAHHSGTWCCTTIPSLFTQVECSEDVLSTTLFLSGVTLRKSRSRSL